MSTTNGHTPVPPGVSLDIAHARGYHRIDSERSLDMYTNTLTERQRQIPGLLIPVYRLGEPIPYTHVLRPDRPRIGLDGKTIKYEWPQGVPLCLDVLPGSRDALADPAIPIWITEGAKKADALLSAFGPSIVAIDLNGVWGWRRKDHDGSSHPLEDLDGIAWAGRDVVLAFDSDVTRKADVQQALKALARHLRDRGAQVRVLVLPQDDAAKIGVDDAIASGMTPAVMRAYVRRLEELPPPPSNDPQRPRLIHADDLGQLPTPHWLIPGVLPANKITEIFGRGGTGKSFVNLDIALSVAQFAKVIYIAAEDAEDYQVRIRAWCDHHHLGTGGLHFWPEPVNLMDPASVTSFLEEVHALEPALIIVDTLALCMTGGDENSTRDMGLTIDGLNHIRRHTRAAILVTHHTGWVDQHERGNSSLRAASRVVMKLSQSDDGLMALTCEKINGAKAFEPRYFRMIPQGESVALIPSSKLATRDAALTPKHYALLEALSLPIFVGGATHTQLVEHLEMSKSTVNFSLSKLIGQSFVEARGGRYKQYSLTETGRAEVQNYLFSTANPSSVSVQSQFNGSTELRLNWAVTVTELALNSAVTRGERIAPEFSASSVEIAHSEAVVQSVQSEFSVSSVGLSCSVQSPPPLRGDIELNSAEQGEQEIEQPIKPPGTLMIDGGDLSHDRRREAEVDTALERGQFKEARRAAGHIRGNVERTRVEARIDEAAAGAMQ